jgi:signal transduction histidine kinase
MRPLKTALIIAGVFLVASVIYITGSDWMVLHLVGNKEELDALQSLKGLAYVTCVAAGLFAVLYYLLKRISGQIEDIQRKKDLLLDREREVMVGTLAASLVHDINNLLGAIKPNIRFTLDTADLSGEPREALEDAELATQELINLAKRLRDVSKQHQDEHKIGVDIGEFVTDTVEMLEPHASLKHCKITCNCQRGVRLQVYPSLLRHAVINLLLNAADATSRRGSIRVSVAATEQAVELSVADNGPGIPEELREAVRKPFTTSKAEGVGLGLFAVTYCTQKHGGTFEIEDSSLGGSKMHLVLPLDDPNELAQPNRSSLAS